MFRIWKIKAESRLDALLARLKPSPLMARALPLSLLASLLVAEPAFAQANFEGLADNILGLLSNGLLRTLAIIAIIVVGLLWFLGRASVQMLVTVVVGVVIVFSAPWIVDTITGRSEEHTSELQSLMRISYAVFCFKTKHIMHKHTQHTASN